MTRPNSYTPKYLTAEQLDHIDKLIQKHKAIFFDDAKKLKLKNIQADIKYKLDELVRQNKKGLLSRLQSIEYLADVAKTFFPELAMKPMEYWTFRQTDILRREIDSKIPLFTPHHLIPNSKTRENITKEIHNLEKELDDYLDRANLKRAEDPGVLNLVGRLHIIIFQIKVKIEFYGSLLLQPELIADQQDDDAGIDFQATANQQSLFIYYLLEYAKLFDTQISKSKYARLVHFLTGKNYDNIRKSWNNMHNRNEKAFAKDLLTIRPFFEDLGALGILRMIDNELEE